MEKEYLNIFANKTERDPAEAYKSLSMKDLQEPYNQADMFRHHCDMLIDFAKPKGGESTAALKSKGAAQEIKEAAVELEEGAEPKDQQPIQTDQIIESKPPAEDKEAIQEQ